MTPLNDALNARAKRAGFNIKGCKHYASFSALFTSDEDRVNHVFADFDKPQTEGVLRAQAREALGDTNAHTIWCPATGGAATPWAMVRTTDGARPGGWHATEVEAMIGALEFAAGLEPGP